jgi:Coenzyme PQQ synthesis protein D (PqqD)
MDVTSDRICPNEPDIASKIMDGEAILINLQTGAYYSLRDAGALVWHALGAHRTLSEILQAMAGSYDEQPANLESDMVELLGQLAAENLVRASDRERAADHGAPAPPSARGPYRKPALEKFTDMEELLALDPPTPGVLDGLMKQSFGRRGD